MKTRITSTLYDITLLLSLTPFIVILLFVSVITEILFPLQPSGEPTKEEWRHGWRC